MHIRVTLLNCIMRILGSTCKKIVSRLKGRGKECPGSGRWAMFVQKRNSFQSLGGGPASHEQNLGCEDNAAADRLKNKGARGDGPRWVKVNEGKTLYDVLKEPNMVIPDIPVFVVVSTKSSFYEEFKSGN